MVGGCSPGEANKLNLCSERGTQEMAISIPLWHCHQTPSPGPVVRLLDHQVIRACRATEPDQPILGPCYSPEVMPMAMLEAALGDVAQALPRHEKTGLLDRIQARFCHSMIFLLCRWSLNDTYFPAYQGLASLGGTLQRRGVAFLVDNA